VIISCGLPRRLSYAVTSAACCLVRRCSPCRRPRAGVLAGRLRHASHRVSSFRACSPAARRRAAGVRRKRSRPEPAWREPSRSAGRRAALRRRPGAEPGSGADRRELSLAQAQTGGSWAQRLPSAGPPCQHGSATHSPAPAPAPRHTPAPGPRRQPATSRGRATPPGPAAHGSTARAPATRRRPGPGNTSSRQLGAIPAQPSRRKATAQQGLTCYQAATRKRYPAP